MSESRTQESESEPFLRTSSPSPSYQVPSDNTDDIDPSSGIGFSNLDMTPTNRDKVAMGLVLGGLGLFLPLTWYFVLSGSLSAMGWFALHPPLQSLAITAFLLVRQARFNTHQTVLLGLALPAMALGTASMWWNKHVHGAVHFTTWHSWFGIGTVFWMVLQALIGGASVWFGGKAFGGASKAKKVYKYHRLSGYLLVTLSLLTAHLGGAHSSWALGRDGFTWLRVLAFWVALPLVWIGLELRTRTEGKCADIT
ncbi:hypothetical protein BCR39DRAFT_3781 [Naematelia encephala]|uniref:Cytochrome b561 domain-containing protein n=1 Tax=Naematelia encephala TaxID=71784 RepID=A0A1Y2BL83_9TREE|nr:hypothetical protein BCR39DRAFT_3781 [Naematelia encephala]